MRVQCTNDKHRPAEIPSNKWVKKGEWYTVTGTVKCNAQGSIFAYILAEIDLSDCQPYVGFASTRFGIPVEETDLIEEEQKMYSYG